MHETRHRVTSHLEDTKFTVLANFINRRQTIKNSSNAHDLGENVIFHNIMFTNIFGDDYLNLSRDRCRMNVNEIF